MRATRQRDKKQSAGSTTPSGTSTQICRALDKGLVESWPWTKDLSSRALDKGLVESWPWTNDLSSRAAVPEPSGVRGESALVPPGLFPDRFQNPL